MEFKTRAQIQAVASTVTAPSVTQAHGRRPAMARREKLERWAALLDAHKRRLRPLPGIEFMTPQRRAMLRGEDSPLALAFSDPVLRTQGLANDQLGHGTHFFELTSSQAHHLLCDCYYGGRMTAKELAARVRFTARHPILSTFIW